MLTPEWLDALKLPTKIMVGLFLFLILLLIFDKLSIVTLSDFGALAGPAVIISALLFGCLSLTSLISLGYESFRDSQKPKLLAERRKVCKEEATEERAKHEQKVIDRVDYLSEEEIHYVANCLRKNEQSFLTWVNSGPVSNLMLKGLVHSPNGTHHQDHYPFIFLDFAWKALLERKEEFIEKDDAFKAKEKRRRRG